jgi:hypothetical protein
VPDERKGLRVTWQNERPDNPIHEAEREEARYARQFADGPCYRHSFHSDGRGGGVCECGDTLSADEL